jgi:hypothetical protein
VERSLRSRATSLMFVAFAAPSSYRTALSELRSRTSIPVLLPIQLFVARPIYFDIGEVTARDYGVNLDYDPNCHGAAACTLGRISGESIGSRTPAAKGKPVRLSNRMTGYFLADDTEENCNVGYCFSRLTWDYGGSRYSLKLKLFDAATHVKAANSAIHERETGYPAQGTQPVIPTTR